MTTAQSKISTKKLLKRQILLLLKHIPLHPILIKLKALLRPTPALLTLDLPIIIDRIELARMIPLPIQMQQQIGDEQRMVDLDLDLVYYLLVLLSVSLYLCVDSMNLD